MIKKARKYNKDLERIDKAIMKSDLIDLHPQNLSSYGCASVLGAIIESAKEDYLALKNKKELSGAKAQEFHSAKWYLFHPDGLEAVLNRINSDIDISAMREELR